MNSIITGDALQALKTMEGESVDSIVTDPPAGISFMGKEWDHHKGGRDNWIAWLQSIMAEGLRVLKPGGHALVWALPRTSHWTGMALENAGFEIRDCVYHLFGSGFPKSLNIANEIAKREGAKREGAATHLNTYSEFSPEYQEYQLTENAKKWSGFGTALKPAVECWWLCRKPLSEKTIVANVLKWGTGALNIDASRVKGNEDTTTRHNSSSFSYMTGKIGEVQPKQETYITGSDQGRFPANLIHDGSDCVLAGFAKAGESVAAKSKINHSESKVSDSCFFNGKRSPENSYGDSGSAARFFYAAKPSTCERDAGCNELPLGAPPASARSKPADGRENALGNARHNHHPTVKSQALMKYLITLITPPKGIVLDMFCGSGSTLVAAASLGHPFIGIELNPEYAAIAQARIDAATRQGKLEL